MVQGNGTRTALIVHGYNLNHSDWNEVMWGEIERGLLGRVPMSMLVCHRRRPDLIIWNTGASERDGVREADYIYAWALNNVNKMPSQFVEFKNIDVQALANHVRRVSVTEVESTRTREALLHAIPHLTNGGTLLYDEVIQVTSKNHAGRVLRDSIALWWEEKGLMIPTAVYAAHTGYAGGTASEVTIVELTPEKRSAYDAERNANTQRS